MPLSGGRGCGMTGPSLCRFMMWNSPAASASAKSARARTVWSTGWCAPESLARNVSRREPDFRERQGPMVGRIVMKRLALLALILATMPLAAFAQQRETVEVDGQETLTGVWKISFPAGASGYMPGRGRLYTVGMESFCRLQQTGGHVSAICLPGWGPDSGDGELDGKDLHLAWGVALARAVIDAKIERASVPTFDGAFALKVFGIRHDAPAPASAHKLVLDPAASDAAGKAKLMTRILEELAAGAIVMPHVANVAFNFGSQMGDNQANTLE